MKNQFVVNQKELHSLLAAMQPICSKKTTLDITEYVLFQITPRELTLKATDLEISLRSSMALDENTVEEASFLVSGRRIFELVREMEDDIEFSLTGVQIFYLSLMCFIMLPIPFIIMTIAPKYTPAYQVYLIFLLESVLGTTWVWVIINEVPSLNTVIGGLLLLTSVLIYMILETRK